MPKPQLTFPCPQCGRQVGVGPELAGRRVRCPLCRGVVTAPSQAAGAAPRPRSNGGPDGVESIFADPEESDDSVIGGGVAYRKPVPPSDTGIAPVTTPRPIPRTGAPIITKPPSSQRHRTAAPTTADAPALPAEEGSPFAGLGGDSPPPRPAVGEPKRGPRGEKPPIPVWVWAVMAALAGYGMLVTVIAAWGWLR